jgi:hypothetical protein
MGTIQIFVDLATSCVTGASVDGKMLEGVASVRLGNKCIFIQDSAGRDLLADAGKADDSAPTPTQLSIATAFGFRSEAPGQNS